jgi:hypothetical protein
MKIIYSENNYQTDVIKLCKFQLLLTLIFKKDY